MPPKSSEVARRASTSITTLIGAASDHVQDEHALITQDCVSRGSAAASANVSSTDVPFPKRCYCTTPRCVKHVHRIRLRDIGFFRGPEAARMYRTIARS